MEISRWFPEHTTASQLKDMDAHYLPFSAGRRNCIGQSLAYAELRMALPMLLRKFFVTLAPETNDKTMACVYFLKSWLEI